MNAAVSLCESALRVVVKLLQTIGYGPTTCASGFYGLQTAEESVATFLWPLSLARFFPFYMHLHVS